MDEERKSHVLDWNAEHIDRIDPRLDIIVPTLIRLGEHLIDIASQHAVPPPPPFP